MMIYLKRFWNLIAIVFVGCVFILITPPSLIVEVWVIAPILYIFKNENYIKKYAPFPFRLMWWLESKLMFNTNKEEEL
jgi:hypothetical protein